MAGNKKKHHDLAMLDSLPVEQLQNMFESGMSETKICLALGVSKKALHEWLDRPEQEGFLIRARARAADELVGQMIDIVDDTDYQEVQKAKLRVQTRQWVAERWNPQAYAQSKQPSVQVNLSGMRLDALRHIEVVEQVSTDDKA
jgi:predicted transcriptional regulator